MAGDVFTYVLRIVLGGAKLSAEKCDLFTGDWIPYASGPAYNNESCSWMESRQNCMKNGRPDTGYLFWRWNPRNCELPPFDAGLFLELMSNKTWGFIGDSITRNHVQSLLCILSKVIITLIWQNWFVFLGIFGKDMDFELGPFFSK